MPIGDTKKVTISMPQDLLVFADRMADALGLTRSGFIAATLETARDRQLGQLAAEGYRYYSEEANEFAADSGSAVAEALGDDDR